MSLARIGVSGVVRTWDGADRTGVNAAYVRALLSAGAVPLILSPLMGASLAASLRKDFTEASYDKED